MVDESFFDSLEFRKARLSDARKVGPLVRELAGEVDEAAVRKRFRRLVIRPSYVVYLFLHEGEPLALWVGREGYFLAADSPYMQLLAAVVHPDYQRQGLGTLIAQRYLQELYPGSDYCQFWFITQHDHLHDFYESVGLEKTGARFVLHEQGQGKPSFGRRVARKLGV